MSERNEVDVNRLVRWWQTIGSIKIHCQENEFVYEAEGELPFRLRQFWLFLRVAFAALSPDGFYFSVKGDQKISSPNTEPSRDGADNT